MKLQNLPKRKNRVMPKKRVGRGYGSTKGGHTVGRGVKGQNSRSGHKSMVMFEGGNTPFFRRMPKYRGFNKPYRIENQVINVHTIEEYFNDGDTVSLDTLREKGLIKKSKENVKVLGLGSIKKKVVVEGLLVSESAKKKILDAKGQVK